MKRLLPLFALLASTVVPVLSQPKGLSAAPAPVEGFSHVKSLGGIDEYRLEANGLQVLLMPDRSAPVVTFMVTYHVGSRNEVTGTTGATHLLEHLMFKGSVNYNKANGQIIDRILERTGAQYNASTWLDRTNYYQTIGSEHLDMVIGMESDRMRNLLLEDSERKPEMTVVRNEFERGENSPFQSLIKEMMAAAYQAHPYHHSTIGWRSDIEKVSIEKLKEFYDTFYWPNNATVTVLGDFTPEQALGLVKKYYGAIPKSPAPIPEVYTEEPEQTGPRRVTVRRAGQLGVVALGYKSIGGLQEDFATLNVLANILGDGQNSRLYRALTDKGLTTNVSPYNGYFRDPTLFIIFAAMAPGSTHDQVEKIILEEIERVKKDGVTPQETEGAVAKLLTETAFSRDGSFSIAGIINEDIAVGGWENYVNLPERYKKVTPAMVQSIAAKYFNENQSTTGWFVPIVPDAPKPAPAAAK